MPIAIEPAAGGMLPRMPPAWATHLHAAELDEALVRGAAPDASPLLRARAAWLTSPRRRRIVAKGINTSIRRGAIPWSRLALTTRVRVVPEAATDARGALEQLARRLLSPIPPAPAGVILARRLLTDGVGPLYAPSAGPGALRHAAEQALHACES
ncbi:MAG TPA: hypothetical protein VII98_12070 [Solirubrobacteraceae bacterium]